MGLPESSDFFFLPEKSEILSLLENITTKTENKVISV